MVTTIGAVTTWAMSDDIPGDASGQQEIPIIIQQTKTVLRCALPRTRIRGLPVLGALTEVCESPTALAPRSARFCYTVSPWRRWRAVCKQTGTRAGWWRGRTVVVSPSTLGDTGTNDDRRCFGGSQEEGPEEEVGDLTRDWCPSDGCRRSPIVDAADQVDPRWRRQAEIGVILHLKRAFWGVKVRRFSHCDTPRNCPCAGQHIRKIIDPTT
jgi:hypothetical protein